MARTMTKAASKELHDAAKEQDMTLVERNDCWRAAQDFCRERKGTYVSVMDVGHAVWKVLSARWK